MSKSLALASPPAPSCPSLQLLPHPLSRLSFFTKLPTTNFYQGKITRDNPFLDFGSGKTNKWAPMQIWNSPPNQKIKKFHRNYATLVEFPRDYDELLKQATNATKEALKDGKKLLEVEFPTAGLESVSGDAEGGIEMTRSMVLVRDFCGSILTSEQYTRTRIFFPDMAEVARAKVDIFEGTFFKLDYLTKPSGLEDFGFGKKLKMSDRLKPTDEMVVVAYPYFNVNEMLAVEDLYMNSIAGSTIPMLIFNGELDRIRSGYYPSFFYPKLGALCKNFLPKFETVYYIHNFKGSYGGTLFRAYPGPWQVLRKINNIHKCILQKERMPSLKEVALDILPQA